MQLTMEPGGGVSDRPRGAIRASLSAIISEAINDPVRASTFVCLILKIRIRHAFIDLGFLRPYYLARFSSSKKFDQGFRAPWRCQQIQNSVRTRSPNRSVPVGWERCIAQPIRVWTDLWPSKFFPKSWPPTRNAVNASSVKPKL